MPKKATSAKAAALDIEAQSIPARRMIREAMRAAKRALTIDALFAQLRKLDPTLSPDAMKAAHVWNFKQGHINFEHDAELQTDLWSLTTRGRKAS